MLSVKVIRSRLVIAILLLCTSFTCSCMLLAGQREEFGPRGRGDYSGEMPLPQRIDDLKLKSEHFFNSMCDSLGLDKQQKKEARKLYDKMLKNKKEMAYIFRGGYLDIDTLAEKVTEINIDYYERISALLNMEQRKIFVAMKKN
jgi:hypothetical protein